MSQTTAGPLVLFERREEIFHITLNRPDALNAYNRELLLQLEHALMTFKHDKLARVAILTGNGRAFCSGADLKQIADLRDGRKLYHRESGEPIRSLQSFDLDIWKPMIAAVNGYALAGGFVMAMACDIRIASTEASFGLPMIKRGFTPASGAYFLTQNIPLGSAMELAMTGDPVSADEALKLGIVNRVVPPDQLLAEAKRLAERICANPPEAVNYTKQTLLMTMNEPVNPGIRMAEMLFSMAAASDDSTEGVAAWVERRAPRAWRGTSD